ncbi:MAG: sugar ABC transporter permease [Actinomycetota bacterium]
MSKIGTGVLAIIAGVGGSVLLFWALNWLVDRLPKRWAERLRPFVFIGPALFMVAVFLVYPALRSVRDSFYGDRSEEFVGLENYRQLIDDPSLRSTLINNVIWVVFVPISCVIFGLAMAVLADRLSSRWESGSKSVVFMPMAISAVGASTIWLFIYYWRPSGREQIGLLNAIWTGFGNEPVSWLQQSELRLNTIFLLIIMIWAQTGFAMVLLSAAIKGVPEETIEAARIDGATERQVFWRVTLPQIRTTVAVVFTTITIGVIKVFDIVFVMTGGNFDTDVIANRFVKELFDFRRFGQAAAIVVFLMVVMIPIIVYNIRSFRQQEAAR